MEKKFFILALIILSTPALSRDMRPRNNITPIGKTHLTKSANNTDVINIVNGDNQGISHNKFIDFSIEENIILNNSSVNGQSQLGGVVEGNKNIDRTKGITTIITEVMGGNLSSLNAGIEVFGEKSDLIIANQNGININGANFINTKQVTLTTGKIQKSEHPNLKVSLFVDKGNITLDKKGIVSQSGDLNLISKTVNIGGEINAKNGDINIISGTNKIEFNHLGNPLIRSLEETSDKISISGNELGSMYGNRITLHSSDRGSKVKIDGTIEGKNKLSIDAKGDILFSNTLKSDNISLTGEDLKINTELIGKNINIYGKTVVLNQAPIADDISVYTSGDLWNDTFLKGKNIKLTSGRNLLNLKPIFASEDIVLDAKRRIAINGIGKIFANNNIYLSANAIVNNSQMTLATEDTGSINISSNRMFTNYGKLESGAIFIEGHNKGQITNIGDILAKEDIQLSGEKITNTKNILTKSKAGYIDIFARKEFVNDGNILASNNIQLRGNKVVNNKNILANNEIDSIVITANKEFINNGEIRGRDISIKGFGEYTENFLLNNGNIVANDKIQLAGMKIENNKNILIAEEEGLINIRANQSFTNRGKIESYDISIRNYNNNGATKTIINDNTIIAKNTITLNGSKIVNNKNILTGKNEGSITINTDKEFINKGIITSDTISAGGVLATISNSGDVLATSNLILTGANIINNKNILTGEYDSSLNIYGDESLVNNGKIKGGYVSLKGETILNKGDILGEYRIRLGAENLINDNNISTTDNGGDSIDITTNNSFTNNGKIEGNFISIARGDLLNIGNIIAKNSLVLEAPNGNIINKGTIETDKLKATTDNIFENKGNFTINTQGLIIAKEIRKEKDFMGNGTIEEKIQN